MKLILSIVAVIFTFTCFAQGAGADTSMKGIKISFKHDAYIFPESWRTTPIKASAQRIAANEKSRSTKVVERALDKYPVTLLQKELKAIYFLKSMKFYEVNYGGTNSENTLYLTNDGVSNGFDDQYIEQTFHHEFSSILLRNNPGFLHEKDWKKLNDKNFDYNDPENGVGAIRGNRACQDIDTTLGSQGFLTQYSMSGIENDLNTFAQNLFQPSPSFWKVVDSYPRIKAKTLLLTKFYQSLNNIFTDSYFRKLNAR